jgi:glycosyltransferase involved in cell wall biosynthesis
LRTVYWSMDLLCLPSRREGFGNVVLEAAASGIPAVVSNATGCRDTVVDGRTGWVVPVGDEERLAQVIKVAASDRDELRRRGRAARQRAVLDFDRRLVWSRIDQFLEEAATRPRRFSWWPQGPRASKRRHKVTGR